MVEKLWLLLEDTVVPLSGTSSQLNPIYGKLDENKALNENREISRDELFSIQFST
jgi:hypothetical protein